MCVRRSAVQASTGSGAGLAEVSVYHVAATDSPNSVTSSRGNVWWVHARIHTYMHYFGNVTGYSCK